MISYNVDKKNKVVIAKLTGCEHDVSTEFTKRFLKNDSLSTIEVYPTNEMHLRDSYVGKCRFEKDEPFDAELGKKIAKDRCLKKYYKAKDKMIERIVYDLQKMKIEVSRMIKG